MWVGVCMLLFLLSYKIPNYVIMAVNFLFTFTLISFLYSSLKNELIKKYFINVTTTLKSFRFLAIKDR